MNDVLKPCPFCGGKADIDAPASKGKERLIFCKSCFASICEDSTPDAVKAWNLRAALAQRAAEPAREISGDEAIQFARESGMERASETRVLLLAGVGDLIRFARLVRALPNSEPAVAAQPAPVALPPLSTVQPDEIRAAENIAASICREVAELPDRTSPADWPQAMLVTHDELQAIVLEALGDTDVLASPPIEAIPLGAYVLATKYNDGDPGDMWALGFYDGVRDDKGRHYVKDSAGRQIRGNGFRRVARIRADVGNWLLNVAAKQLERCPPGTVNLWTMLTGKAFNLDEDKSALAAASTYAPPAPQPCGHPASLLLRSAETGEPLYCELCDCQSARRDAEQREQELLAEVRELRAEAVVRLTDAPEGSRLTDDDIFKLCTEVLSELPSSNEMRHTVRWGDLLSFVRSMIAAVDGASKIVEPRTEWLDNVEAELRKVPGLNAKDVEVLTAMASAGVDYAELLDRRKAVDGAPADKTEADHG